MANDQSIELRVSLQERQMETLVEIVEEIRTNYVTKAEFREAMAQQSADFNAALVTQRAEFRAGLATQSADFKEELRLQRIDFKEGLGGLRADMKEYVGELLTHYATKEDLAKVVQYSRNWVISVGISLAALQFTMQLAFFQWYIHLR
ncbi:hypothetical protein GTP45_13425 [Pseudoduganella sp. FT55W]|uniref:DUF1640 domain-containing protein n=1 Tax=Duganella rivi TaxID=2666083 RepID=A0A7X4GQJ3_9BURK|nr:hypothetical protein [Duganella rivi]MYM67830.1 hypothetical protein [Duganella rivi]